MITEIFTLKEGLSNELQPINKFDTIHILTDHGKEFKINLEVLTGVICVREVSGEVITINPRAVNYIAIS